MQGTTAWSPLANTTVQNGGPGEGGAYPFAAPYFDNGGPDLNLIVPLVNPLPNGLQSIEVQIASDSSEYALNDSNRNHTYVVGPEIVNGDMDFMITVTGWFPGGSDVFARARATYVV